MADMLDELGDYLEAQGVGTLAEDLFIGAYPDKPDSMVAVMEYQGDAPSLTHSAPGVSYERRRIQIMARGLTRGAAMVLATGADVALQAVRNMDLGGTRYLGIYPLQSPFPLGRDANERYKVVCNYRVEKAPSA